MTRRPYTAPRTADTYARLARITDAIETYGKFHADGTAARQSLAMAERLRAEGPTDDVREAILEAGNAIRDDAPALAAFLHLAATECRKAARQKKLLYAD